jgi:hypothetical protein
MPINFNGPKIDIQTKEITIIQELCSIIVNVDTIDLFNSATIQVAYFGTGGNFMKIDTLIMEGEDYTNWNNDDQYIYNYVYTKLNITPKN